MGHLTTPPSSPTVSQEPFDYGLLVLAYEKSKEISFLLASGI